MTTQKTIRTVDAAATIGIPFVAAVVIVLLLLKSLALVPAQVEAISNRFSPGRGSEPRVMSVNSIEEAELVLGSDVWVPIYFPDYLIWPPSSVRVQRYPDLSVTLTFRYSDQREALVLKQFLHTTVNRAGMISPPSLVSRRSAVQIGDVEGVLVEGLDREGATRNLLYWTAQGRFIMMDGELPASELVTMASSLRSVYHMP